MRYVGIYRTMHTRENYQKRRRLKNMQRRLRREKLRAARKENQQKEETRPMTTSVEEVIVSDNGEQIEVIEVPEE